MRALRNPMRELPRLGVTAHDGARGPAVVSVGKFLEKMKNGSR